MEGITVNQGENLPVMVSLNHASAIGVITTSQTWIKSHTYRLRGYVYVTAGAKITIEAGTKIISNKDSAGVLVIYKDATILCLLPVKPVPVRVTWEA